MAFWCIDPVDGDDGTGSSQATQVLAEAMPFKNWSAVTFTGTDTYLQKEGSVYIGSIATTAHDVTVGIYGGDGVATMDRQSAGVVFNSNGFNGLDLSNFIFTGDTSSTPNNLASNRVDAGSNVNVDNCIFRDNNAMGLRVGTSQDSATIKNSQFLNNSGSGVVITSGGSNILIEDCVADGNGSGQGAHGFSAYPARFTYTSGWTQNGNVYSRAFSAFTLSYVANHTPAPNEILTENIGTPTTPASGEFGQSGGVLYINLGGTDANTQTIVTTAANLTNIKFKNCIAINTLNYDSATAEGHGFAGDDGSLNITWERCLSENNQGHGFNINFGYDCEFVACVARNHNTGNQDISTNKSAFSSSDARNIKYYNCVADSYSKNGFCALNPVDDQIEIINCIAINNIAEGVSTPALNPGTISNSCIYNNGTDSLSNFIDGGGNLVGVDPLFIDAANGNYNLQQSSPCVSVGTQWWGLNPRPESLSGEPLPDVKIDLGAYQSTWDINHPKNL